MVYRASRIRSDTLPWRFTVRLVEAFDAAGFPAIRALTDCWLVRNNGEEIRLNAGDIEFVEGWDTFSVVEAES